MNELVISSFVACAYCGRLIRTRELAEHEEDCRQRDHETRERFE